MGSCLIQKTFCSFFLRLTLHIHLQRKHALWFCNESLDWPGTILEKTWQTEAPRPEPALGKVAHLWWNKHELEEAFIS